MQAPTAEPSDKLQSTSASENVEAQLTSAALPSVQTSTHPESPPSQLSASGTTTAEDPTTKSTASPPKDEKKEHTESFPSISKSTLLQSQILTLTSFQSRLTTLRTLPAYLLVFHPQSPLLPLGNGFGANTDAISSLLNSDTGATKAQGMGSQAHVAFRMLGEAKGELIKKTTQDALKAAHESEARERVGISLPSRRERKKRRIATADSPAPFPSFQLQMSSVFPPLQQKDNNISCLEDFPNFIRDYNKVRKDSERGSLSPGTKLSIWEQSRPKSDVPQRVSDPLIIRVAIPDIVTVFVKLTHRSADGRDGHPVTEGLVALGPREKV
ncbi:hypothetical protein EW145_g2902 [Phellinidium pouzarii]|uniref:Uncharacterized protein n=1 Tax=Phellinidium pouzarii TaxID=167371 RepID=A0A4S4L9L2_9AGAM|nr:hypothetical protein EW145_g2902 [Phellinidium pouzarii]